ncbi:MAG TPA: hypothetical protein PK762_10140 [Candidatus Kapabacteria bacterium]|nr:hypothetical protein [Candidatus Kapabacteria bacterium]
MPVIQVDTEILRSIVKESVIEAMKTERLKLYEAYLPEVNDAEMLDIISIYGDIPKQKEYVDMTSWFDNEN